MFHFNWISYFWISYLPTDHCLPFHPCRHRSPRRPERTDRSLQDLTGTESWSTVDAVGLRAGADLASAPSESTEAPGETGWKPGDRGFLGLGGESGWMESKQQSVDS